MPHQRFVAILLARTGDQQDRRKGTGAPWGGQGPGELRAAGFVFVDDFLFGVRVGLPGLLRTRDDGYLIDAVEVERQTPGALLPRSRQLVALDFALK
jgi:hypothetical protein